MKTQHQATLFGSSTLFRLWTQPLCVEMGKTKHSRNNYNSILTHFTKKKRLSYTSNGAQRGLTSIDYSSI
ncbi:MAG: hypothetical protein ABJV04_18040 [Aliiglaciecola sp.]|uniref:hypothetical protein n=1 Tax=Aliiglaciecola sp. TaxID=1872441 RepID=UPI003299C989